MKIRIKEHILEVGSFKNYDELMERLLEQCPESECKDVIPSDFLFPASYSEKMMWTSSMIKNNMSIYNIHFAVCFNKNFNIEIFKYALNEVIQANMLLRSSFHFIDGELYRKTNINVEPNIDYFDYHNDLYSIADIVKKIVDKDIIQFDLSIAPLFKVKIINIRERETIIHFNFHHIIFDGPSVGIFVDQLIEKYSLIMSGVRINNKVKRNEFQINCTIINRENHMDSKYFQESDLFWKNQLVSADKSLVLPKNEMLCEKEHGASQHELFFTSELSDKIHKFCKENAISAFILFISLYSVLLYKYTNKQELLIGVPVTTRDNNRIKDQIGCFINTVVVKVELWGNPSFREILYRVKNNVLSVMEHYDYPIMRLYEILKMNRNEQESPLFQNALSYLSSPFKEYIVDGDIQVKVLDVPSKDSMYALYIEIVKYVNNFVVKMQYSKSSFDQKFIKRMGQHYLYLFEQCIKDIDMNIEDCEIVSEKAKRYIIENFNKESLNIPYKNFYSILKENCQKQGGRIAVRYSDQTVTYKQLLSLVDHIANYLWSKNIRKGKTIGLLLTRSPLLVATLFAVRKIGVTYVPLENNIPTKRMRYYIDNAGIEYIIIDSECDYECIDKKNIIDLREGLGEVCEICNECNEDKETIAYICYTSGTTGMPKGIMATEENVYEFYKGIIEAIDVDVYSNWLYACSLSFDPHVLEIIIPLLCGKMVTIVPDEAYYDISKIRKIIVKNNVDFLHITPTKAELIFRGADFDLLKSVKGIAFGAEPLRRKMLYLLQDMGYSGEILNIYGPTETCLYSTVCRNVSLDRTITVGKPIRGYNVYILDDNDRVVPVGIPGQICISGKSVSSGYYGNPQITKEVFTDDPFNLNVRMYRTGDIGKWDEEGSIIFIGRKDNQIKIRGNRVEIDEIEINIERKEYVKQAKVVYHKNENDEIILIAYIKLNIEYIRKNNIEEVSGEDIKDDISDILPEYMIPSHFVIIDEFPMTISGKIDVKRLPPITAGTTTNEYILPKTELEILIYKVFAEVLQISRISVLDNFFSLGGESMKAMQAIFVISTNGMIKMCAIDNLCYCNKYCV